MKNKDLKKLLIDKFSDLKTVLHKIEEGAEKIIFVTEEGKKLFGVCTDGDIRRWILATRKLEGKINEFCNKNPLFISRDYNIAEVKQIMLEKKIEALPVINNKKEIIDVLIWDNVFSGKISKEIKKLDVPAVIMAGGKGSRLDPFTRILPKPLIPIGDKPVIEIIIDKFLEYGIKDFYISVNHKSRMIKAYFEELDIKYRINFIEETTPLGTAGSLKLLAGKIEGSFFVSNCDILIESDYSEILRYHLENENDITLVASIKHYNIPYGICEIEDDGTLLRIQEKPEYNFLVNTGMYLLKSKVLHFIPDKKFFHITNLIAEVKNHGGKIGIFPISDKSWINVGEWEEFQKAIKLMKIKS